LGNTFYSGNLHGEWYVEEAGTGFNHITFVTFENDRMMIETRNGDNEVIFNTEKPARRDRGAN